MPDHPTKTPVPSPARPSLRSMAIVLAAHAVLALVVFHRVWFAGEVLFFRDISVYYYPNQVFLARELHHGVWPLWNPMNDAGAPFLMAYPVEVALVGLFGPAAALALDPTLHLFLAMAGATVLGLRIGLSGWGSWCAGAAYGLSGFVLSSVNLFELFHGLAWAPWLVAAFLHCWNRPSVRRAAGLAIVAALQCSTLAAETVLQTMLLALGLASGRPDRRRLSALVGAGVLAALMAAPVIAGVLALIKGSSRVAGMPEAQSFGFSLRPLVLLDAVLPRFFGDVHTFSDYGYWGQPFFASGYPYFLSLYLGPSLLLLALRAGGWRKRLWLFALLGVLLAIGNHGPLAVFLSPLMRWFRTPAKFFFLTTLSVCLLAGRGLDRALDEAGRPSRARLVPGAMLGLLGVVLARWPSAVLPLLARAIPDLLSTRARPVVEQAWPADFALAGLICLGVGLIMAAGRRWATLAGLLVVLDLWSVNRTVNVSAPPAFYELRPAVRSLVERARALGRDRWFAYGISGTPGLRWNPHFVSNLDVWLYAMDRQSILPRQNVLDDLEGAFDEDRVGWAPEGSTFAVPERQPRAFAACYRRLQLANVRWVLSFAELPTALVTERGIARLPEIIDPLRIYELNRAIPRAFWVAHAEVVPDRSRLRTRLESPDFDPRTTVLIEPPLPSGLPVDRASMTGEPSTVTSTRLDAHNLRLEIDTPPGYIVVAEGFHRCWHARSGGQSLPILRANGRYWAIPTPGGKREIRVRFEPAWRALALLACAVGLLAALAGLARVSWAAVRSDQSAG